MTSSNREGVISSNLVAQLNADWRVVVVSDRDVWRCPAWMLQRKIDGAWRDQVAIRTREGLRALVKSPVGRVGASSAKILVALPERVDRVDRAALNEEMVVEARRRVAAGWQIKDVAAYCSVSAVSLRVAVRGLTWRHLPGAVDSNRSGTKRRLIRESTLAAAPAE